MKRSTIVLKEILLQTIKADHPQAWISEELKEKYSTQLEDLSDEGLLELFAGSKVSQHPIAKELAERFKKRQEDSHESKRE